MITARERGLRKQASSAKSNQAAAKELELLKEEEVL